jgi:hypothetical protein
VIGEKQIIAARLQGLKPAAVFIEAGLPQPKVKFPFQDPERAIEIGSLPTVHISESELRERLDLRFLAGCRVHIHGPHMSDELLNLAEKLAEAKAAHIVVCAFDTPELIEYKNGEWTAWK